MDAAADYFRQLEHDVVGLHWLLRHRPGEVQVFAERAAQVGHGNDIYFAGDATAPGVAEALRQLPRAVAIHAPAAWLGAISSAWEGRVSTIRCAEWKRRTEEPLPDAAAAAVAKPLTAPMLHKLHETGLERLTQPYHGAEEFLDLSFGFAIVLQNKIVSACTAFYAANGAADLATETYASLRNHGYGGVVLRAAVQEALRRGLQPQIHASACNGPVAHLARKLGFDEPEFYDGYARQG